MIRFIPTNAASALLLGALALPAAALAQTTTPMPMAPAATPPAATAPASPAPSATSPTLVPMPKTASTTKVATRPASRPTTTPAQRVDEHIADLHRRLAITPAQETLWTPFAQVMRDNATALTQSFQDRATKVKSMTAPDNMQSWADMTSQRAQDMEKLAASFRTLYAGLTPDQQHAADEIFQGVAARHK